MKIKKIANEEKLTIQVEGRLDTLTSPTLEKEFNNSLDGITELEMDMSSLEYISSAGLRVLLKAQKMMEEKGSAMTVTNCSEAILEIFDVTGFTDILNIQ